MQLLYGNDGNNYRTLAKTSDMDEHIEKALKDSYLFYQYVENEGHYSKVEKQPEAITYVTTDLGGILKKEHILFVKNARMSNFFTPCSYAHFLLFEADRKSYGEPFLPMIKSSFIQDKDSLLYDGEMLKNFQPEVREEIGENVFEEEILKVIVGYIMLRDKSSAKVKVVIDAEGDRYNDRSMALIQEIYRYLPYDIRKKHGFLSYTGTQQNVPGRVKLEIYNPESLRRIPENYIDLNSMKAAPLLKQLPMEYREYLDYIFSLTDEQRNEHYKSISVGQTYLAAADYIDIYRSLARWSREPIDDIFSEWVEFALSESRKKSPGYYIFQGIVGKRLDSDTYNNRLSQWLEKQNQGGIEKWNAELRDLITFGEQIKSLEFRHEPFLEWFCSKLIPFFCKQYTDFRLVEKLEEETKRILEYQCGEKFRRILDDLAVNITKLKEQKLQEINRKIELEKEYINHILCPDRIHTVRELEETSKGLEKELNYPEQARDTLAEAWISSYTGLVKLIEQFYELADYEEFQEALRKAPEYISQSNCQELEKLLSERHHWIEKVEKNREIRLLTELPGRRYQYKISELKKLLAQINARLQDCALSCVIDTEKIEMPYEKFRELCNFIEEPQYENEYAKQFFTENEERLLLLLQEDCFSREHFMPLLNFSDKTVCAVVLHYCCRFRLDEAALSKAAKSITKRFADKKEKKQFIAMLKQQEMNKNLNDMIRLLEGKKISSNEESGKNETGMWIIAITAILAFGLVFLFNAVFLSVQMEQIYVFVLYGLDVVFLIASMAFAWFFDE